MAQIPGDARIAQYTATSGQTVFTYDFLVYEDDEITVQQGSTTLTLTTDYTVQDAGEDTGGTITLVTGATAGDLITITGNTMIERDTTFTTGGDFLASAINAEYDRLDNITKELITNQGQNFRLAVYSDTVSTTLPNPTARTSLVWNSAANALENSTYDPDTAQTDATAAKVAAEAAATASASSASDSSDSADAAAASASDASDSADAAAASAAIFDFTSVASDIIPDTDSSRDLGTTAKRFKDGFIDDAVITTSLTIAGEAFVAPKFATYQYQVAYNVAGGAVLAETATACPLNTEVADDIGITLSSNQLTLPAGTYTVDASQPFYASGDSKIILYDTTGSAELCRGSMIYSGTYAGVGMLHGQFTLTETSVIELRYLCRVARATDGLGLATISTAIGDNVFTQIRLGKYA